MKGFLRATAIPALAVALIRLIAFFLRIEVVDPAGIVRTAPTEGPYLFACWHNRLLLMGYFYQRFFAGQKGIAMVSRSRDGEIIAGVNAGFGLAAARGSSSRKGERAALEAIRKVKEGYHLAITPDGPRGPLYSVHPGVIQIAQLTGRPIVSVTYHLSRRKELRSWDRFQIPYPFARCRFVFGEPIHVPADLAEGELEAWAHRIGEAIGR